MMLIWSHKGKISWSIMYQIPLSGSHAIPIAGES